MLRAVERMDVEGRKIWGKSRVFIDKNANRRITPFPDRGCKSGGSLVSPREASNGWFNESSTTSLTVT